MGIPANKIHRLTSARLRKNGLDISTLGRPPGVPANRGQHFVQRATPRAVARLFSGGKTGFRKPKVCLAHLLSMEITMRVVAHAGSFGSSFLRP
jgi:hypothetical protein